MAPRRLLASWVPARSLLVAYACPYVLPCSFRALLSSHMYLYFRSGLCLSVDAVCLQEFDYEVDLSGVSGQRRLEMQRRQLLRRVGLDPTVDKGEPTRMWIYHIVSESMLMWW